MDKNTLFWLIVFAICLSVIIVTASSVKCQAEQVEQPQAEIQQLQEDVYLLGERYEELNQRLMRLEKSHELSISVSEDLSNRIQRVKEMVN